MTYTWHDFLGFLGDGIIIVAYVMLQTGKLRSASVAYSLSNAVGASLIILSLIYKFNFAAFIVEFFWVLVSVYGLGRYFLHREWPDRT